MKKINALIFSFIFLLLLSACSHGDDGMDFLMGVRFSSSGSDGGSGPSYVGTKSPTEEKAVGDIVFWDMSATPYSSDLELTAYQKASVISVIFYKGLPADVLGERTLGVGVKTERGLLWAREDGPDDRAAGYNTKFSSIIATPSETGFGKAATATFTGDVDGCDNWYNLKVSLGANDDTEISGNYPAWKWAYNYSTNYYSGGFYLPTLAELCVLYRAIKADDSVINAAIAKAGGSGIPDAGYWSSSQSDSGAIIGWGVWFNGGYIIAREKCKLLSVCAIHSF